MHKPRKPMKLWEKKAKELEREAEDQPELPLSDDLQTNIEQLEQIISGCTDVTFRDFAIASDPFKPARIYMLKGSIDRKVVTDSVIAPLTDRSKVITFSEIPDVISAHKLIEVKNINQAVEQILAASSVLFVHGSPLAWAVVTRAVPKRNIAEPDTHAVVRGPRDGFIEDLETNMSLISKRIKSPKLKSTVRDIGKVTKTKVAVLYIEGVADPTVLNEIHARLDKISIDGIVDSGQLEQLIEDNTLSPFPQIANSERSDGVSAALLDGRIAIMVDNTPFALIVPAVLTDMLQSSEDYYERFHFATAIRTLRYIMFVLALLGPSLYIAITTYHPELIPTTLLISLIGTRAGIPFPALVEALMMELAFEALREAGVRLPKPVGQAVSIVGALVIGQAAVQAGLVSPIMVIVVAGTGIASFTVPGFNLAISVRLLRFVFMLLAGFLGLYGINFGLNILLIHLVSLRSFGVPYLSPLAPVTVIDWKDMMFRAPTWWMYKRPTFIAKGNVHRQDQSARSLQPPVKEKDE